MIKVHDIFPSTSLPGMIAVEFACEIPGGKSHCFVELFKPDEVRVGIDRKLEDLQEKYQQRAELQELCNVLKVEYGLGQPHHHNQEGQATEC